VTEWVVGLVEGLDEPGLVRAEDRFRRHGAVAVVTGRLLPGLRSFIAVPAGIVRLPVWQFFVFNLLGTAFWVTVLAVLGSALGQRYELVDRYSSYVTAVFVVGLVSLVVYRVVAVSRRRRRRRASR
jgi:membrane protein DedA with SNARE-associated domain